MRPVRQSLRGFTLLELMLGIVILSVMAGIVYGSFSNVVNSAELARDAAAELRFRQFISRSFSINLASVYVDQAGEESAYRLVGTNETGPFGPADTLEFATMLEMPGATSLPGVIKRVRYALVEPDDSLEEEESVDAFAIDERMSLGNEVMLEIYEEPLVLESDSFGFDTNTLEEEAIVRKIPVRSFDVLYYDNQSEEWVEEWDSTASKRMPWAIRVRINLARDAQQERSDFDAGINFEDDADIDMSFSLPVSVGVTTPFIDFNHTRNSFFQSDGDNMFDRGRRR